jgi:nucleoside-diphosphate kinase
MEKTLGIIKPDAVAAHHSGNIIAMIEKNGFTIVRMQKMHLSKKQAEQFYAVHKERPFFGEMTSFISSGPVIVMVLEKNDAIKAWRDLMGATDPKKAAPHTIRAHYAIDIGKNAVHGSDAPETAAEEIAFFFPDLK